MKKILIIDDEAGFTRLLKLNLEQTGEYEVEVQQSGKWGVKTARDFMPDVILLDVVMPDMSGRDVAAQLGADSALKGVPIIYLTATISKEHVEQHGGKLDQHMALAKPARIKEVVGAIEQALATSKGARS